MATTTGSDAFWNWMKQHKKELAAARDERYASIKQHNEEQFIKDFRRARGVYTHCNKTGLYFELIKRQVWQAAENHEIRYRMEENFFVISRTVMIIL
jgi:uncharacterized OB-fold protein